MNRETAMQMLESLAQGQGILVSNNNDEVPESVFPTIHDIPGVDHCGFGLFQKNLDNGGKMFFNAGGAMSREESFSWTSVWGSDQKEVNLVAGLDVEKQKAFLENIILG